MHQKAKQKRCFWKKHKYMYVSMYQNKMFLKWQIVEKSIFSIKLKHNFIYRKHKKWNVTKSSVHFYFILMNKIYYHVSRTFFHSFTSSAQQLNSTPILCGNENCFWLITYFSIWRYKAISFFSYIEISAFCWHLLKINVKWMCIE